MDDKRYVLTAAGIEDFCVSLWERECSGLTVEKYKRDIYRFYRFLPEDKEVNQNRLILYKRQLSESYKLTSANSMLAAVNSLFTFLGWAELKIREFKCQRRLFCPQERELSRDEYLRLVRAAERKGNSRLSLVIQTLCSCGLRVGELKFVTVESAEDGVMEVSSKGKSRRVFLQKKLSSAILKYARHKDISSGPVFLTKNGRPIDRWSVWREMKGLCGLTGIDEGKVFPHNLRHLFAREYYKMEKDIVKLADLLGHSSVNTTRIYTVTSGAEHMKQLSAMRLLI